MKKVYFNNYSLINQTVYRKQNSSNSSSSSSSLISFNNNNSNSIIIRKYNTGFNINSDSEIINNNNNYNKMNNFSSFIFYNENNNKVLMIKNNINKLYKAVPHNHYGFPSFTLLESNSHQKLQTIKSSCCGGEGKEEEGKQQEELLNNKIFTNKLPIDKIEKVFNNKNSFKNENIYYLGSLVTPYYLEQVKRNYFDYYLVLVKDCNCINKSRLELALTESILPNDPASTGGTKDKTLDILMEWKEAKEFLKDFKSHRKYITPETQYLLKMLSLFEKDNKDTLAKNEDKNHLGIDISLEYAPEIESIPIRSNTLVPFNTTNLIISHNNGHCLLVDPGANKEGSLHMINVIEKKLIKHITSDDGDDDGSNSASKGKNLSIFITHNHKDHWEGIGLLEKHFPEATVYAHEKTLNNVVTGLKKVAVQGLKLKDKESVDQFLNEIKTIDEIKQANYHTQEKLYVGNGDRIFHVISTPGHTDDSLCLFEKNSKTLIAGDHIVGFGSSVLDFHTGDMTQYIDSTQGIIDYLMPKVAIPAHGPINYDPILLLNNYIKHRILREEDILNAYKSGKTSLTELLDEVYGNLDPKLNIMAMGNIKLHLQKLKKENKI